MNDLQTNLWIQSWRKGCLAMAGFAMLLGASSRMEAQTANVAVANTSSPAAAAESSRTDGPWASFRNGGESRILDAVRLPETWSPSQGIGWNLELPGYGQSSPIISGDRILLTAVEGDQKETNLVVCLERASGKQRWKVEQASTGQGPSNFMYSRAAPTPVADAEQVFAFFESGDLIAVNIADGSVAWKRDLKQETGAFKSNHGLGSSLAQSDDFVFINLEHDGPSFLFAINKADGSTVWKQDRPSGSSWASPVVSKRGDKLEVVLSSGGEVVGLDAASGETHWKLSGLSGNSVPSPLVMGDRILLGARKSEFGSVQQAAKSNLCLKFMPGKDAPEVEWRSKECIADYASPVQCGDFVYLIDGNGVLGCLHRETGETVYRKRLGFKCWATPIVNQDRIFLFGKDGTTLVLEAGNEFRKLGENQLWDKHNPPSPVTYKEHFPAKAGGHGHGGHSHGSAQGGPPRKPGEAMLAGMMKSDKDGDGRLAGDEIPKRLVGVMENIDLNKDGTLDSEELKKMAESFAAKRSGSRQSSRDPIVYAVAADQHGFLIRTGTRLYSIGSEASQ